MQTTYLYTVDYSLSAEPSFIPGTPYTEIIAQLPDGKYTLLDSAGQPVWDEGFYTLPALYDHHGIDRKLLVEIPDQDPEPEPGPGYWDGSVWVPGPGPGPEPEPATCQRCQLRAAEKNLTHCQPCLDWIEKPGLQTLPPESQPARVCARCEKSVVPGAFLNPKNGQCFDCCLHDL